jgi:nitrite reductase/ring-hydroxylating ferredoxin subunit
VRRVSAGSAIVAAVPGNLAAVGTDTAPFVAALATTDLPAGTLRRVTFGDLDVLLAHTANGIVAIDDRCPHMAAPLSLGRLDGCIVDCPLHSGRFDLTTGETIQMPTTGGLDADGSYVPSWTPGGREPKVDTPGLKTEARRQTRVRRLRFYRVRISGEVIEVAVPTS